LAASLKAALLIFSSSNKTNMTQDTKNKFAEILAAQLAAANLKTQRPATPKKETPAPFEIPEYNSFTEEIILPSPPAPTPAQAQPAKVEAIPQPEPETEFSTMFVGSNGLTFEDQQPAPALSLIDYSEKAFAIVGDTKPIKDTLKQLGGSYNPRLKCGAGWIFSKTRESAVRMELAAALK
jgi:hypothetical protein